MSKHAVNAEVVVRDNNVDYALKQLKRKMKDSETMLYYEKHLAYEKPSEQRRRKHMQAVRRAEYESKENQMFNNK